MGSSNKVGENTFKSVQRVHSSERSVTTMEALPPGAILLGVLKKVENELRRRLMLARPHEGVGPSTNPLDNISPLWFVAETERNIFLWRQGKSLDDQRDFDFWIDVPALIEKRRSQLSSPSGLNPFVNPLWGSAPLDQSAIDRELDYLDEIEALRDSILPHAEALSRASHTVRCEMMPSSSARQTVLLPSTNVAKRRMGTTAP